MLAHFGEAPKYDPAVGCGACDVCTRHPGLTAAANAKIDFVAEATLLFSAIGFTHERFGLGVPVGVGLWFRSFVLSFFSFSFLPLLFFCLFPCCSSSSFVFPCSPKTRVCTRTRMHACTLYHRSSLGGWFEDLTIRAAMLPTRFCVEVRTQGCGVMAAACQSSGWGSICLKSGVLFCL